MNLCPRCREVDENPLIDAPDGIRLCDWCQTEAATEIRAEQLQPTADELRAQAEAEADHYRHIWNLWNH